MDLASGELCKDGIKIKLQEQPFQVLAALLERPLEVVTRAELQKRLWPEDMATDFERGLNKAINRVRDALDDDASNPQFIETLPQRGYRWLLPVERPIAEPIVQPEPERVGSPMPRRGLLALGGALAMAPIAGVLLYRFRGGSQPVIRSIAVLPLANLSADPGQEYFSDGMTDVLIDEISRISSLRVISRTSIMRYKGGDRKSVPEIARELNVDAIVEGTVALSGSKVRITAQLIQVENERHLWSERYERDLAEVLSLQSEVAASIAREIRIHLTPQEQTRLARTQPLNPEALAAFMNGTYFLHKSIAGIPKSIEFFSEAVRLDPSYAGSHAGLAQALLDAGLFGIRPSMEIFPAARAAASKALEIDPSNAAAYVVLGDIKKGYDWDLAGAAPDYLRAQQLNSNYMLSHLRYSDCLSRMGRHDEAMAAVEQARRVDPVSAMCNGIHAMNLFRARRYDRSVRAAQQALELDGTLVNALWWQGMSYSAKREYPAAIASLTRAVAMNNNPLFRALLGHVYGIAGERAKALRILEQHTKMERAVSPVDFAIIHAGLGNADATFERLEVAYRLRSPRMHELTFAYFDPIRSDARYQPLLSRVGLPNGG